MNNRTVVLAALVFCAARVAAGAPLRIAEAAPPESFLIINVPDWAKMKAAMDDTGIGEFLAECRAADIEAEPTGFQHMADPAGGRMFLMEDDQNRPVIRLCHSERLKHDA